MSKELDLDRLKAVSETMAKWIKPIIWIKPHTTPMNPDARFQVPIKDLLSIKDDLLRLADENEELREANKLWQATMRGFVPGSHKDLEKP
jgi:hypothetical protein